MKLIEKLKLQAKIIKKELKVIYIAYKKPGVPWYAKILASVVIGYALSPIDLIPDFIPIIGYLDDLILVPLGIYLVIKLIPKEVLEECRIEAEEAFRNGKPKNWVSGIIIILLWLLIIALVIFKFIF
jgi:uncharacterized membrane protein YkvA (DUF1232 family)